MDLLYVEIAILQLVFLNVAAKGRSTVLLVPVQPKNPDLV